MAYETICHQEHNSGNYQPNLNKVYIRITSFPSGLERKKKNVEDRKKIDKRNASTEDKPVPKTPDYVEDSQGEEVVLDDTLAFWKSNQEIQLVKI